MDKHYSFLLPQPNHQADLDSTSGQSPGRKIHLFDSRTDTVGRVREFRTGTEIRKLLTEAGPFASKDSCPMFSPGIFDGPIAGRTPTRFGMVVGEHDAGEVTVGDAVERLKNAGIAAFIYTSASHTAERPRWRVVAPLRSPIGADEYLPLLHLLNGALGGALARESGDLSRRWFYGSVTAVAEYRMELVQGGTLDVVAAGEHDIGPVPVRAGATRERNAPPDGVVASEAPLELSEVREMLLSIDPNSLAGYDEWLRIVFAVKSGTSGSDEGRALLHEWSSSYTREHGYSAAETDKQWDHCKLMNDGGGVGIGTLRWFARRAGWIDPDTSAEGFEVATETAEKIIGNIEAHLRVDDCDRAREESNWAQRAAMLPDEGERAKVLGAACRLLGYTGEEAAAAVEEQRAAVAEASEVLAMSDALARDFDMNDAGNVAVLFALRGGDLRYDASTSEFMFWHSSRWERDEHGTLLREAIKGVQRYWSLKSKRTRARVHTAAQREIDEGVKSTGGRKRMDGLIPGGAAAELDDLADKQAGWAKACGNVKQINAIKTLAATEAAIVVTGDTLDRNPHLLGVANGVVDLRTGQLRPDARDEFVTRRVPVAFNPDAKAPRWEQFQREICGLPLPRAEDGSHPYTERPALVAYKQRWAGSMLIGENIGQKFYTATGEGSNGKSLELESYVEVLGPLAVKLPNGAFIAGTRGPRDADAASPTLASLRGARLALASETEAGSTLNTGDVKAVTGDEQITARMLHSNGGTFRLEATPVLLTNHPPNLKTVDNAIISRVAIVPYDRTWNRPDEATPDPERPDADTGLRAALRAEREGILAWMVAGAVEVLAGGGALHPPEEVTGRTDEYLRAQSVFGSWLATLEPCEHREGMQSAELLEHLRRYAQSLGRPVGNEGGNDTRFGRAMQRYAAGKGIERDGRSKRWPLKVGNRSLL